MGAKNGILFKNAVALENAGRTQIVALDKTGTITNGEPKVTDIVPADGVNEQELLRFAAGLEAKSEHPLARAIMAEIETQQITYKEAENFEAALKFPRYARPLQVSPLYRHPNRSQTVRSFAALDTVNK